MLAILWPIGLAVLVLYPLAAGREALRFCALMYWPFAGLALVAALEGVTLWVQAVGWACVFGYLFLVYAAKRWGY